MVAPQPRLMRKRPIQHTSSWLTTIRALLRDTIMGTVTYHHQPGIHATRGTVPIEGTKHPYTVTKVLWPEDVEQAIADLIIPSCLHVCSGLSALGDVRLDLDATVKPNILGDASRLPCKDQSFTTVLADPPYNGRFQWNHDLLSELCRVATWRIIFQHWFLPINPIGQYKKLHAFHLTGVYLWQPRTYFGRVQVISVLDRLARSTPHP